MTRYRTIVCDSQEVDPRGSGVLRPGMRLNTRSGREAEVMAQVKEFGGFTVFWATENLVRAHAITRLENEGRIKVWPGTFPWSNATVVGDPQIPEGGTGGEP